LLHSCTLEAAAPVIEKLRAVICDYRFAWDGRSFALGASIGVVQVTAHTASVTAALSAADSACYMAKDSGRNRIHVYQETDADLARRHGEMQWVSRLHAALAEERLFLVGQRITPTGQRSTGLHLEVLVRLRDEDGAEVAPGTFIPAAERYSLMPAIDRWVIRQTFAWLSAQPELLQRLDLCAINLSGSSVGDAGMRDYIVEQRTAYGIAARQICFEITETAAVANLVSAAGFVRDLRAQGFRFALDDFGSGMSSFAYLKNLPVDYLKIDGNFVRDILSDAGDDAMVQAFNQIGHVMGLTTVAEFVESQAILDRLRVIGVDYAQGFGIARPQPVASFAVAAGSALN
jgi:EAL domain-containing protein (putative c-di-GMP-specific phosphodiesterase class I)